MLISLIHHPGAPENFSKGSHPSCVQPAMMKTRFGCKVSQANVIFHYPVLTGPNATFITLTDNKWSMIFITVPG
ncbi:hypothetical protein Bca4012_073954 [Brassica carinata]